ncbi:hypothetical protein F0562_032700 [Nyssa sinensis]|uniref:Uncharacterized protein n=1 Tax=Nyssa sinensis TaxID=561372 RepID=A0A5J5ATD9_9ASTE|nr:hypothetical protein F0562_032700 [Nyssa sinensis]
MVTVLEHCRVAPPPGTVPEKSFPLTLFDLPWLPFPSMQRLLFYQFPHPKSHFIDTLIPKLKNSASLTLKHFFPLAGNLIIPPDSSKPEIRYVDGNSVSLTFAESTRDFNYLTENHPRNVDEFHHLVPQMPQVTNVMDTLLVPLLALQVTLFPNSGICFGYTFHHAAADGGSFIRFLKSWASITKFGGDEEWLAGGSFQPLFARTVSNDPNGIETSLWRQVREIKFGEGPVQCLPSNPDRATFVMDRANAQRLKKMVLARIQTQLHVSTFTVTCAYVWVCMVKSCAAIGEEVAEEEEPEGLVCVADCRSCFKPPIPENYFGNCLTACFVTAKSSQLVREEGFLTAAELIGEAISRRPQNEDEVLKGLETWLLKLGMKLKRLSSVAGSPRLCVYDTDFGWGRPKKTEIISTDVTGTAISINERRDSEGDVEIDFNFLTENHPRNADEFHHLVPQMPLVTNVLDTILVPLLALQVTLFPNSGICFGYTFHHAAADGGSFIRFLKSWASITKLGGDEEWLAGGSLQPLFARTVSIDPNGIETSLWRQMREIKIDEGPVQCLPSNPVRATFVMDRNAQRLKNLVSAQTQTQLHVSTFTVTCAFVWVCIMKSGAAIGEEVAEEDEPEGWACVADCRSCFEPPISENYFGNCLTACFVTAKSSQLVRGEGFLTAAELIGEAISKRPHSEDEVLKSLEKLLKLGIMKLKRLTCVPGSPRLRVYDTDFGWGRPKKTEIISMDVKGTGTAICINECRDSEGDVEIGLCFPKIQMDAFATIFYDGLKNL